jgi:hypothetical protein
MRFIIITFAFLFISSLQANTVKRSNLAPTVVQPEMPGTPVEIEELKSSPNPLPGENASEKFRGTLKAKGTSNGVKEKPLKQAEESQTP